MNKMNKVQLIKFSAALAYVFAVFTPLLAVHAAGFLGSGGSGGGATPLQNPLNNIGSFPDLIDAILQIVIKIGVPIAVLAIIYSGFLFVTAQGNEEKLNTAKSALTWTVVGTAILLGSWILAGAVGTTINALRS
jgi:hypothetical protein